MFGRGEKDIPEEGVKDVYVGSKSKKLICHFILNNNKESMKPKKIPLISQDITHKKRTWPVERSRILTDFRGESHIYLDVNDSAVLSFNKDHADKCKKCSTKMTIDARNGRDLVKRKTITALWGIDTMPMMLLIVLGIVLLAVVVFTIYLYGDNQTKDALLQHYLKAPSEVNPSK